MDKKCTPIQGKFFLAFNKADISDVLEQASRWTCRNFLYQEDVVRGKIDLISQTPVTAEEAYQAFLAALSANNLAIYPSGRYYKVVRIADAKKVPMPIELDDGTELPNSEQPMTKVFRTKYVDADQLKNVLGNFTSPQGADVQAIPPDVVIVTDIALNLRRLEKLIDSIDKPSGGDVIRVIQVQYASAKDLADKINQIFQAGPGQPGRPGGKKTFFSGGTEPRPSPGVPVGHGPSAPQSSAPAAGAASGGPEEVQLSKVMADERTNKLIVIANEQSFQRILDMVKQLDLPTSGEGTLHVVSLKNAKAEELAQTLQSLAQGTSAHKAGGPGGAPGGPPGAQAAELFSGEVKITADKAVNALVILASGADFNTLAKLIEKLDQPRRQVFVEAVIMEVNLQNETDFGMGVHTAVPTKIGDPLSGASGNGFIPLLSKPGRINSLDLTSLLSMNGFLTGFVGPELQVFPGFNIPSIGVLVQALQKNSDVNVISTPHLLTSDNEEAEITVGQKVPFQAGLPAAGGLGGLGGLAGLAGLAGTTGTTTPTTTGTTTPAYNPLALGGLFGGYIPVQHQDVALKLKLKPQINEGDYIRMEIDEQTEEIAEKDPLLGPTTAKRTAKTKVVAHDQQTIVIGGLIQERTVQSVSKVPVLGDIPILGYLFRDKTTTKQKTNLLLFLTPYIIRDPTDFKRIFERKMKERQEFVEQFYGRQPGYTVPIDYTRKPGFYAKVHKGVEAETMRAENGGPGAPGEKVIRPGENAPPEDRPSRGEPTEAPPSAAPTGAPPTGATPAGGAPITPSPGAEAPPTGAPSPDSLDAPTAPPQPPPPNEGQ